MLMPNWFKDTLDSFVDSSDDGSNIEAPANSREIHMSSNNIPGPGEKEKGLNEERDLLKNWSQRHQQQYHTFLFSFDI